VIIKPWGSNKYCLLEESAVFKNLLFFPRITNVWKNICMCELHPKVSASCVSFASRIFKRRG
jgi:hypothetical protein